MDMEQTVFPYSTKNIPIPTEKDYKLQLIEKTEACLKRMRWKAAFFLNPNMKSTEKPTYGFKSRTTPPAVPELSVFERKITAMISNVKFCYRNVNQFQKTLTHDVKEKIQKSNKLIIPADKTNNYYKMSTEQHKRLLHNNVTKTYSKASKNASDEIAQQDKAIAERLELADRINVTREKEAYITLKDHKPNFINNPTCRLINPRKSEIGQISKQILDRINNAVIASTQVNLWKNTYAALDWFNDIEDKASQQFIVFDIVEFYPSISADLMNKALDFAASYTTISDDDRQIISHAKQSLLRHEGEHWNKTSNANYFDVTMGSYDGAETCELVGAYILSVINKKHTGNFGLYRDDGLGVIKGTPRQVENLKKSMCQTFKDLNLRITIDANKSVVNFLDTTLNLHTGKYAPFSKPKNTCTYVHKQSNHPRCITRNIPLAINTRLSKISSDEAEFNKHKDSYQDALNKAGYNHQLTYSSPTLTQSNRKGRKRKVIWFNPPYNSCVSSKIGSKFLRTLDQCFPAGSRLHKIFNRNYVKVSYSCTANVQQAIHRHNLKSARNTTEQTTLNKACNCRRKQECPMENNCMAESIIYQATVIASDNRANQTYIGLTKNAFKTRYYGHLQSFKHADKRAATALSNYIWCLKDSNVGFSIKWRIMRHARPCTKTDYKRCQLCLWEKYFIIFHPHTASLNSRSELMNTCRHARKLTLANIT